MGHAFGREYGGSFIEGARRDASILPVPSAAPPNMTTIAIAASCADLLPGSVAAAARPEPELAD